MGNTVNSNDHFVFKVKKTDFPGVQDASNSEIESFRRSDYYKNQEYLFRQELQERFPCRSFIPEYFIKNIEKNSLISIFKHG